MGKAKDDNQSETLKIAAASGGAKWLLYAISAEERESRPALTVTPQAKGSHGRLIQMLGSMKSAAGVRAPER